MSGHQHQEDSGPPAAAPVIPLRSNRRAHGRVAAVAGLVVLGLLAAAGAATLAMSSRATTASPAPPVSSAAPPSFDYFPVKYPNTATDVSDHVQAF